MSQFTFNFGEEDEDDNQNVSRSPPKEAVSTEKPVVPVVEDDLENLIKELPSAISYSAPPRETGLLPRRTLSDVRVQLMAESELDTPIPGLESDLETDVYEGGFKTWECSVDLAKYLASSGLGGSIAEGQSCLELGCGSALPSLYIFSQVLARKIKNYTLILADYNAIVLSTVTLPNLLLAYASGHASLELIAADKKNSNNNDNDGDGDLELSESFLSSFLQTLKDLNLRLRFISGPWGESLLGKVTEHGDVRLLLASETIYAPSSIEPFSDLVLALLLNKNNKNKADGGEIQCTALVAAKKVYFGVGGGIEEFNRSLVQKGGKLEQRLASDTGVGRGIWQVFGL